MARGQSPCHLADDLGLKLNKQRLTGGCEPSRGSPRQLTVGNRAEQVVRCWIIADKATQTMHVAYRHGIEALTAQ
jgi:hypothetical protein